MAYYPVTSTCNGQAQPNYSCNGCPTKEYGRVGSLALIKITYVSTVMATPSLDATWVTMLSSGNGFILPATTGSYDGGSTEEASGFGRQVTTNGNTTHTLVYKDPNYSENCDFYNALRNSTDYTLAYVTGSKVHFAEAPVTFTPRNPVADDIKSFVTWEITCKWIAEDSPCPYNIPPTMLTSCNVAS